MNCLVYCTYIYECSLGRPLSIIKGDPINVSAPREACRAEREGRVYGILYEWR